MKKTLFLMLGYPGSGKTTASKIIAKLTGAEHLWADQIRRQKYAQPTYSHQENVELYGQLNKIASELVADGKSLVFDTNFNFYKDRQRLREIADLAGAQTLVVWVQATKSLAKQRAVVDAHLHTHTRVLGRMPAEHFDRIANNLEPPRSDETHIIIDGTRIDDAYIRSTLQNAQII